MVRIQIRQQHHLGGSEKVAIEKANGRFLITDFGIEDWDDLACLDGAEISVSGLKIGRSPVQILPKTNFSIIIKLLPVKSTGK